ncbi:MAG: DUF4388 domain-containing protein [Nitrospirae bacterium]|nr:DUF4388 domain-containing protein [Nitrospirota bacterium]
MSLEGHLSDLSLPDILQIVHISKKSGVLNLESQAGKGRVVFHEGQILYASMQGKEMLGERLIREGKLKEDDLEIALRIQKDRKVYEPLGSILTENKFIGKDVLENLIQSLVKEVIYEMLSWDEGVFRFEPEQPMPYVSQGISVSTEYILLEGTRLRDEGKKVISSVDEKNTSETPAGNSGSRSDTIVSLIEELRIPCVRTEMLVMILRIAGESLGRAVIFKIKGGSAIGFGQVGISMGATEKRIKDLRIPVDKPSVIKNAMENLQAYRGLLPETDWNSYIVKHLGEGVPEEVFIAPLIEGKEVTAVLYGDNLPGRSKIDDTSALEAFVRIAGIALTASKPQNE